MFFNMGPGRIDRKPKETWVEGSGPHIIGVTMCMGYKDANDSLCIPEGTADETKDLLLWAYERGFSDGKHWGDERAKLNMRKALGIT